MKFRVYNEKNIDRVRDIIFATYFRTKKEAVAFAATIENPIVEKKLTHSWIAY